MTNKILDELISYCRENNKELYREYASRYYQISYDDVTIDQRSWSKNVLLPMLYSEECE